MTCDLCRRNSGEYDRKKLCCAAREFHDASKATVRRLYARAESHGHAEADVRAAVAELRRQERKPVVGEAAR